VAIRWREGNYDGWRHPGPGQTFTDRESIFGESMWGGDWHPDLVPQPGDAVVQQHKALPDEAASASRLGMTYIHIPVDLQNPTDQDFEQFCSVMERLNDVPVHVYCIANYRVSAFFYRYRRDVLGMDETQARGEMEAIWHPEGVWAAFVDR
jgi:protein tyrosine phosphatase (PTP) superfamily phosphohydrolase (DUF442 family)